MAEKEISSKSSTSLKDASSESSTQCAVYDQTPGSQQKKINVIVRNHNTVQQVIAQIGTQFAYAKFELLLQPHGDKDLVSEQYESCLQFNFNLVFAAFPDTFKFFGYAAAVRCARL